MMQATLLPGDVYVKVPKGEEFGCLHMMRVKLSVWRMRSN